LGHKYFSRPLAGDANYGILERALDSILTELGDESNYVEYWTRQEWRSIEAHADVDEFLAKHQDAAGTDTTSSFRYPKNGHVLYLQVGSSVRGPTCLFPDRQSGGDLLRPVIGTSDSAVEVVTVPAVEGRLLRFKGDFLHAVPRPTDLWLLKFVQGAPQYEPEEEWGRSVVLFNTWSDEPPLKVSEEPPTTSNGGVETSLCKDFSEWSKVFELNSSAGDDTCDSKDDETKNVPTKIWLLGNQRRRDYQLRTLKLSAPESIRTALFEETAVSRLFLEQS